MKSTLSQAQVLLPMEIDFSTLSNAKCQQRKSAAINELYDQFSGVLKIAPFLTRELVSNQWNKKQAFLRWFKFKEAFSGELVRYFINTYKSKNVKSPCILDPFAGVGTTLTTAALSGWNPTGIEIMPVGVSVVKARIAATNLNMRKFGSALKKFGKVNLLATPKNGNTINYLKITNGAFPKQTEISLINYLEFLNKISDQSVRYIFWFACLSILEEVSYTRKDGQYLRWDCRSNRQLKSQFNKGRIIPFKEAIDAKLSLIKDDIATRSKIQGTNNIKIIEASCLDEVPNFPNDKFHLLITSPPYCNRYDYTRTYALELAFIGKDDNAVKDLRQAMLSSTVENRSKKQQIKNFYYSAGNGEFFEKSQARFDKQYALAEILSNLERAREEDKLNNNNIPKLVEHYFYEMNILIGEFYRILKSGGRVIMVNDNVQYNGDEIPVDLILSDFAKKAGFTVEHIWVLPKGKGNSSQQMGNFGRKELRKCVYVWVK